MAEVEFSRKNSGQIADMGANLRTEFRRKLRLIRLIKLCTRPFLPPILPLGNHFALFIHATRQLCLALHISEKV